MNESLHVLWNDGEYAFYRGSRPCASGENAVLIMAPAGERPSPTILDRVAHYYELKSELDGAWAARPIELVREEGRTTLVLEDPGGEPLASRIGAPMEVGGFLRLAIGIAGALGNVHRRGLVHKDVKPEHVLVDCADGEVRLTGFGIASQLPRERQRLEPPETIAGTLAYMAPEQTGRMNRSIDSRSDLYSLGVTFYQMLTGSLPFAASDPMEWVHCHIARRPTPPDARIDTVPAPVSRIIMKLLAKAAEERYQTAAGLQSDLKRCLATWEAGRRIDDFPLCKHDVLDRLLIPERLYGREREIEVLLAAFDRAVKGGEPELVLVSGYSGIGKSTLVHELHKAVVPRGLFASGKFDQYKRDIPYSTIAQAFQGLVRSLLNKNDAELMTWRGAFLEALEPNGRLMVDLVPELKLIIGDQPPVPELEPQQARSRFQLVFRRFIGVFARPDRPLVLFLDDLQWLDAAALDLIEDLLTRSDLRHLMLIGAYRGNEVDAAHPLMRKLETVKNAGVRIEEITLSPLACDELAWLIADALRCEPRYAAPLAELVEEKTAGNPFFVIQFLYALAEEGLLRFDHDATRWLWDLDRIHAKGYADNVVDLMVGKLTRLPAETQDALRQLACLGNVAEVEMLSMVLDLSEDEVHTILWPAVLQELIERMDGAYRFSHDRVQEATYSLIRAEARAEAHLLIGRLLVARTPPEKREEVIFEIVSHLNRGAALIPEQDERDQLAELNLIAGRRAKASSAYAPALAYLNAGVAQLAEDSWQRRRELIFALELNRAGCEFLIGAPEAAEVQLSMLSTRAATTIERAAIACLRADLYVTFGQSSRAIAIGLEYLRHLGIDWSPHPTDADVRYEYERIWIQLGGRTIEELVELPLMSDPASLATLDVLMRMMPPALFTDANLPSLVFCRAVNLSLERGNSDGSCYAYVLLGILVGLSFGHHDAGFRFARLGHDLVERRGLTRFAAGTYLDFGNRVLPFAKHVRVGRDLVRRAFEAANKSSDLVFAANSCAHLITNMLAAGDPLRDVQREAEHGLAFAKRARNGFVADRIATQLGLVRSLRGLTPTFGRLDNEHFDELQMERRFADNPDLEFAERWYWIRKLHARFLIGDYAAASAAASRAKQLLWNSPTFFEEAEYYFYGALTHAASCDGAQIVELQRHRDAMRAHHNQLQVWAENCPENFENRAALVGAEIARIEGRALDAMELYEQAIRSARANGFVHNEALANELAARFYAGRGFETISRTYLRNARYCYLRWGADGKVRQLEEMYPELLTEESRPGPTSTITTPVERLDLATVIKVSQAVSGEIVMEKMLDTLMRTALEQAGAERGLLILSNALEPRIAAEAKTSNDAIVVELHDAAVTGSTLPETLLHTVLRREDSIILDDAASQSPFADDPYIREHQARSILCLPLTNQGKLIGVLYLENNLTPRVFAPARIAVLKLIASQAAISLENTRLYRNLEQREAKIRGLVDANIIGICVAARDGRLIEANDAYLRMVGYDREDLLAGRISWMDLTPPEWRGLSVDAFSRATLRCAAPPFEKEYFRKDGGRVPVLVGVAGIEGIERQTVSFVLDLTERKRTEKALHEREAKIRGLFDANIIGIFIRSIKGRIIEANDAFLHMLGYVQEDIASGRFHRTRIAPPEWRNLDIRARAELKAYGTVQPYEKEFFKKDGGRVPVLVGAAMLERDRIIAFVLDLTERKRMETEAGRSEQRYREVQTELAHANRVATMGHLTASIAHEVNQPITAAVTNAHAALRWLSAPQPDLEEVRQALNRIVANGNRAGEVIGRIRALIQKAPPRKDGVAINEAILEVIALVHGELAKNSVSVRTQLAKGLPSIEYDRVQLQQVILNLIVNAIEAMSGTNETPRELLLSTEKADPDAVLVAVRDSGPGLAPGALERLFDAFYTTKANGMGLGLSICHSIIEAHGGRLWASANEPRGAVFQFSVPTGPAD